jgi:putative phage-type endonuclease
MPTNPVHYRETPDVQAGILDEVTSLATPTSVLLSTAEPETDEWFAQRRAGLTATDIPKILGLSIYGNALSVWADKRGEIPPTEAGEAAKWGQILEDPVAREWAARNQVTVAPIGTVAHVTDRWKRCSLDRKVYGCPDGPCPLEVKTRSAFVAGRWSGDIPDDVLAQVAWQMEVTGYDHIHLAVLIGGQQLREFRVNLGSRPLSAGVGQSASSEVGRELVIDLDTEVRDFIVAEAERVWGHVEDGTPPTVEADELLARILDQIHSARDGVTDADPATVEALVADYDDALHAETEAKAAKTAARARLIELMGDGQAIAVPGVDGPAVTYYQQTRRAHMVQESTSRVLRVTAAYRKAMTHDE